ncbi:hypothetical protein QQS21_000688 [Conoideocrella luteorostrata]|uniref:F-box domain-containing protein n=1 Tax=Conoideocrella luteorostrata TaxID=1105319 RepID=A0AAJ0G2M0_9HYPO|nr:hypothetical protein QQS21_000688 [Conoideocrella luteorostrata]
MGGADVYCALCGGPLCPQWWEEQEDNDDAGSDGGEEYDSTLRPEDRIMNWLRDVRLICENPNSPNPMKVYISGVASHEDHGIFDVGAGHDPNFPRDLQGPINAYSWTHENPLAIPFHWPCYCLLCKAVGQDELDKESLYAALKGLAHTEEYENALNIDYGPVSEFQEQYWVCQRGYEYLMFSPCNVPPLDAYYSGLPKVKSQPKGANISKATDTTDIFARLPPETQLLILGFLDISDVLHLRAASSSVFNLDLRNSFWRTRVSHDMPWLYDIPALQSRRLIDSIDWAQVYKDLYIASSDTAGKDKIIHGLVNRRRIWQTILPQVTKPYLVLLRGKTSAAAEPVAFQDATATKAPRLILPDPKQVNVAKQALATDYFELATLCPVLHVSWSKSGDLMDIAVGARNLDPRDRGATNEIEFPDDDWLTGFIATTREDLREDNGDPVVRRVIGLEIIYGHRDSVKLGNQAGDKRLIHVSQRRFAVGIKTEIGADGRLSKLSILQQPCSKVYNAPKITSQVRNELNLGAGKWLWRNEVLPPPLRATQYSAGYWNHDMQPDVSPMEALVFGTTEEELADITSLSADTQFGAFQVTYGNRSTRSIGPRPQALKTLKIDGRGGERIVELTQTTGHIPGFIRFVTNRDRQLIVGHQEGEQVVWPPTGTLAGFYGWWSKRQHPSSTFGAIGCLYDTINAHSDVTGNAPVGHTDLNGYYWEPSAPQPEIRESGPIWGAREADEPAWRSRPRIPGPMSVVCFLDCTRPVAEISSTLCHSTNAPQLTMCGITFKYVDNGEEVSVGPDIFPPPPSDNEGANGQHWCWCEFAHKNDVIKKQMAETSHFVRSVNKFHNLKLKSLRIWLSEGGNLLALQFMGDGCDMPIWTRATQDLGDPAGEIRFFASGGEASGIKLFFNSDNRAVSREDSIVVAVQAMKAK